MRKLLLLILLFPVLVLSQSQDQNYIKNTTYKVPTLDGAVKNQSGGGSVTVNDKAVNIVYLDGLGRPAQKNAHRQSGTGSDLITHIEYDDFEREIKEYLPFADAIPTMNFIKTAKADTEAFYDTPSFDNTLNPFEEKLFDESPLNKVIQQSSPGNDWGMGLAHTTKFQYLVNINDNVKLYKALTLWNANENVFEPEFFDEGYYEDGELYKNVTYDENTDLTFSETKGSTIEFKDKEGKLILKRQFANDSPYDTYYVYDEYGNLTYVIPPLANDPTNQLKELCYQYKYDSRNRMVQKKDPGANWQFMAYDKLDRVIASGPVNSPFEEPEVTGWAITKYDKFGRIAYMAWLPEEEDYNTQRLVLENSFTASIAMYESRISPGYIDGIAAGYTSVVEPTSGFKLLTINYYDDYNFQGAPVLPVTVIDEPATSNVKGLATGNWVRILLEDQSATGEVHYTLYDKNARAIRNHTANYLGGYIQIDNALEFTGIHSAIITRHKKQAVDDELYIKETFEYDNQKHLIKHLHQIGQSGTPELMSLNEYDALGRQTIKKTGGNDIAGNTFYQKVDYKYNIRGWLTSINDVFEHQDTPVDLFGLNLQYNNLRQDISGVEPRFNGDVSETYWRSDSDNKIRMYGYQYDDLNRLTKGTYTKLLSNPDAIAPVLHSYDEEVSYDKNGNLQNLLRNGFLDSDAQGEFFQIDDLDYSYDGNKLLNVTDNTNSYDGFRDGTNTEDDDYAYDGNGNMVQDLNKGIEEISYNHINLPVKILFQSGHEISYLYDATGKKIGKTINVDGNTTRTYYLDGFQYNGNDLQFFPTSEGYVDAHKDIYHYVYNYLDNLGNVRMSYTKDENGDLKIVEENHYYSYGLKHMNYNAQKFDYRKEDNGILVNLEPVDRNDYQYKLNGKEWQDEEGLNLFAMDKRQYDPAIGRWLVQDPIIHNSQSPYSAFNGNPVFWSDPSGMSGEHYDFENCEYRNKKGKKITFEEAMASQGLAPDGSSLDEDSSDEQNEGDHQIFIDTKTGKTTIIDNGGSEDKIYIDNKLVATKKLGSVKAQYDAEGKPYKYLEANGMATVDFAIVFLTGEAFFKYLGTGIRSIWAARTAEGFGELAFAEKYGIKAYKVLTKTTKGTGLEAHHLIEKRFAETLGVSSDLMKSIAVTPAEHQAFTNAWRARIGYTSGKSVINTVTATPTQIYDAARAIYKNYPQILKALGL